MTEQPMEQRTNPPTRFLRLPEVQDRAGLSRSTIYRDVSRGETRREKAGGQPGEGVAYSARRT